MSILDKRMSVGNDNPTVDGGIAVGKGNPSWKNGIRQWQSLIKEWPLAMAIPEGSMATLGKTPFMKLSLQKKISVHFIPAKNVLVGVFQRWVLLFRAMAHSYRQRVAKIEAR